MARKNNPQGTQKGRIVGVIPQGGGWLFIVQAFSSPRKNDPVVCGFATADQLKGQARKKAERWAAWLDEGKAA